MSKYPGPPDEALDQSVALDEWNGFSDDDETESGKYLSEAASRRDDGQYCC